VNYINEKILEIVKAKEKNNIFKIKEILLGMYVDIQMDSSIREQFEEELSENNK